MPRTNYSIDLIKQMAECDANYIRLLKLVPQLLASRTMSFDEYARSGDSTLCGDLTVNHREPDKGLEVLTTEFCIADLDDSNEKVTVEIKIVESFKYTTTLESVRRQELKKWMSDPSL